MRFCFIWPEVKLQGSHLLYCVPRFAGILRRCSHRCTGVCRSGLLRLYNACVILIPEFDCVLFSGSLINFGLLCFWRNTLYAYVFARLLVVCGEWASVEARLPPLPFRFQLLRVQSRIRVLRSPFVQQRSVNNLPLNRYSWILWRRRNVPLIVFDNWRAF